VPNDPCLLHNQPSVEDASFSEPCHQVADVGQRVQGRECAGHQAQEVVEVGVVLEVPMQKSSSLSLVEWEEAMGGRSWMPVA
jgi:hypothetical protein